MPAPVSRLGDLTIGHEGYPPTPSLTASPNVFANMIPVVRQTDQFAPHCTKHCHIGVLAGGSGTVFSNGLKIGRIGDRLSCGDQIGAGSNNVFA